MGGLLIGILFSMVTTGLCLFCIHCSNKGNTSCIGAPQNCSQDQRCVSTLKQTTYVGGLKTQTIERGCGTVDQCNTSLSMSSLISINIRSVCCHTNSCTPAITQLPNETKPLNNVRCPMCLAHEHDCSSKLMNCTGDELYCASYEEMASGEQKGANIYIRGCASASFCQGAPDQQSESGLHVSANCLRSANHRLVYPSLVLLFVLLLGNSII